MFQAEVRLVGDEALNRAVVGGFAFHSHKTNIVLQNQIDSTRNARWENKKLFVCIVKIFRLFILITIFLNHLFISIFDSFP